MQIINTNNSSLLYKRSCDSIDKQLHHPTLSLKNLQQLNWQKSANTDCASIFIFLYSMQHSCMEANILPYSIQTDFYYLLM